MSVFFCLKNSCYKCSQNNISKTFASEWKMASSENEFFSVTFKVCKAIICLVLLDSSQ